MKRPLTAFEYAYILENELKQLIGKHISKAYQLGEEKLRLKIGDRDIAYESGARLNVAKYLEETSGKGKFLQQFAKRLDNARVEDIYQHNKDRIIVFELSAGKEKYQLIFEMFGKGNAIVASEGKTIAALKEESWSDREIRLGKEYKFPKSNIKETLEEALSEKYAIVCMMQLPLGKEYAAEILKKCAIDEKKPGNTLSAGEIGKIKDAIGELVKNRKPYGFYESGKIIDYGLAKFSKYSQLEAREFGTLSEAIEECFWHNKEERSERAEKLRHRLDEQVKRLEELKAEEIEFKKAGDYIYENFSEMEKILETAKSAKLDEVEGKLKKYKAKVNKKEKEIELEI